MGNCFSDPSNESAKGQKLGSGPTSYNATSTSDRPPAAAGRNVSSPPQALGGGPGGDDAEARDRALRAAEERAKAAHDKGVNTSNPKAGKLSAQLAAERKAPTNGQQPNERMMDRGDWN